MDNQVRNELVDRVAIVTGAGKGIGASIARRLAASGAIVVIAELVESRAQSVAQTINPFGSALPMIVDVSCRESVQGLIHSVVDQLGGVHILVNNAAVCVRGVDIEDLTEEQWRRVLGVNLDGVFFCTQSVVPVMKRQKYGRIVNIAALAGKIGFAAGPADYAASKGGVLAVTKWCARVLAPDGITVNAVVPGPIGGDTMSAQIPTEALRQASDRVPLGRLGTTQDVANAVHFLVSDEAAWITGEVLDVNGGFYID